MDQSPATLGRTRTGCSPVRSRGGGSSPDHHGRRERRARRVHPGRCPVGGGAEQRSGSEHRPIRRTQRGGDVHPERPLKVLLANHTGFYAMVTPEWEQRTGAKVEFTREAFGPLPLKLTPAFESGGESWDVAYLWRAWVDLYEQYLQPLDEIAGFTVDDSDMLPAAIEAAKSFERQVWYGLPSNIYTYILYANKKMFADAGVTVPKTYAEFKAAAASSSRPGTSSATSTAGRRSTSSPSGASGTTSTAATCTGPTARSGSTSPMAIKATQDMIDLLPNMPPEVIESPWGIYDVEAKKVFLGGKAAMMIDYQHIWYEARDPNLSALGEDPVEVAIIPGYGGDLPARAASSWASASASRRRARRRRRRSISSSTTRMPRSSSACSPAARSCTPSSRRTRAATRRTSRRTADRSIPAADQVVGRHHVRAAGVQGQSLRHARGVPEDRGRRGGRGLGCIPRRGSGRGAREGPGRDRRLPGGEPGLLSSAGA